MTKCEEHPGDILYDEEIYSDCPLCDIFEGLEQLSKDSDAMFDRIDEGVKQLSETAEKGFSEAENIIKELRSPYEKIIQI